ncbi:MAG: hypothetical protein IJM25_12515 [Eubacterium sp.]|jgi:hypothetical protein|nr:hypothetical protein [Eubacterium sp.]
MVWIILGIVAAVLVIAMVVLYIVGNRMQKRQLDQKEQINAAAQPVSMFIIDKKILPIKDAKLPKVVMDQMPKRYQKSKVPVVKAKVGPQVTTLICDDAIFEDVPKHGEVKAMVSGIYLISVRTLHSKTRKMQQQEELDEKGKKKKGSMRTRMMKRQAEYQKQLQEQLENRKTKEAEKEQKAKEKKDRERAKKIVD